MSAKEKRRQKQIARKSAKRKAKHRQIAKMNSRGWAAQLRDAAAVAPIVDCLIQGDDAGGMKQVLISRKMPDGQIAFAIFLIDTFCLGVKNAMGGFVPKPTYEDRYRQSVFNHRDVIEAEPADALRLIVGAVEYAGQFGFQPHPDFRKYAPIFADVDPNDSRAEYEFGRDGKPFFMSGPHDDLYKCRRVINSLREHCGEGNFDFLLALNSMGEMATIMSGDGLEDDDQDWDDDAVGEDWSDDDDLLPLRRPSIEF